MPEDVPSEGGSRPRLARAALAGLAAALVVAGVGGLVLRGHRGRAAVERRRLTDLSSRAIREHDADAFIELLEYAESGAVPELRPFAAEAWLQTVIFIRVDAPEVEKVVLRFRASGDPGLSAEAEKVLGALRREPNPRTLEGFFGEAAAPEVRAAMEGFLERHGRR